MSLSCFETQDRSRHHRAANEKRDVCGLRKMTQGRCERVSHHPLIKWRQRLRSRLQYDRCDLLTSGILTVRKPGRAYVVVACPRVDLLVLHYVPEPA
jgi:hypothetical protein